MSESRLWNAVDDYFTEPLLGAGPDDALAAALRDSDAAGLPPIAVSPLQGKLLQLLAPAPGRAARSWRSARSAATAPSGWPARCPPDGRLVTLEYDPRTPRSPAATSPAPASTSMVDVRVGPALESLPQLADEKPRPVRPGLHRRRQGEQRRTIWSGRCGSRAAGSLIVVDNVVRGGRVVDAGHSDAGRRWAPAARSS